MATCERAVAVGGEQIGGAGADFVGAGHVVGEVRSCQEHRAGFREVEHGDRIGLAGAGAEADADAAAAECAQAARERVAADRVVDDVDAAAVGEATHLVAEVDVAVEDDMIGAARAGELALSALPTVAMTIAPARLASWMRSWPTPPAPAWTRQVSPRFSGNAACVR